MKTIIAGGRTVRSQGIVDAAVNNAINVCGWDITQVVSGGCSRTDKDTGEKFGVDYFGERWAEANNIDCQVFPADWNKFNRAAGPIRNRQMAEHADALIAVWDGVSKGTRNMIFEARKRGIRVYIYEIDPE